MNKKMLLCSALLAVLAGCGSGRDGAETVGDSNNNAGSANISGQALVGETLTAAFDDADGIEAGTDTYQWFRDSDLENPIDGAAASSYTLTPDDDDHQILVVVRYTDGSGFRETVESALTDEIQGAFTVSGIYVHGLVSDATCNIFPVDSLGVAATTAVASGTTAAGIVNFGDLVPVDGTGLIECSGGTYTDEATGAPLNAPDTRALVNIDGNDSFTISPLTEIAVQRAETAGDLNTAITDYNEAVAVAFGLGDITKVQPTDLHTEAAANDEAGRYAIALALISQLDANDPASSAEDIVNDIVTDLADGTLSDETVAAFNTAQTDLATSAVAANLNAEALAIVENAINNEPEPATFEGLSATVPNDRAEALTGMIVVTDVNFGEDVIVVQDAVATSYGTFSIAADGAWVYMLDLANTEVAGLAVGESINDNIAIASDDGTPALLVVRVAALTNVAEITDPGSDTGEIRFNLDTPLLAGRLNFSFLKEVALGSDGNVKDAYVALYGNEDSNRETLIDLRIQGDQFEADDVTPIAPRFFARNTDHASYPGEIVTHPFTEDQWYEVEITWNVDAVGQEVTVIIDGETVNGGPFQTAAIVGDDCGGADGYRANCLQQGVENIQFRFGDGDRTIPFGSYFVDDIVVYDNEAGTGTPVFEDNFEDSTIGTPESVYREETTVAVVTFDRFDASESTPAQFLDLTGAIDSDDTDLLMGTVSVFDPDAGENLVVGQADTVTTYGTFSIFPAGMWDYTLDTTNATIAALVRGTTETDTITLTSIDGTTADLVITIKGVVEVDTGSDLAARIADRSSDDAGELRYKPATAIVTGRMTATVIREAGAKAEDPNEDAQIAVYGSSTSSANALAYITLDISGDDFDLRDSSGSSGGGSTDGFVEDQEFDIEIAWDASAATGEIAPLVTITIDGQVAFSGADFASPSADLLSVAGGVETVQFRVGGTSDVTAFGLIVDDLRLYSSDSGVEVEVFSDDFEAYTEGNSLDPNADTASTAPIADAVVEAGIKYRTDSFDVFVVQTGSAGGLGTAGNQFARIADRATDDAGELRYTPSSAVVTGRMTAQVLREAGAKAEDPNEDAQIAVYGSSTSSANALAYITLDISGDDFDLRDSSGSSGGGSTDGFVEDQVFDIEIAWDASAATATTAPLVTITIDGVVAFTGADFASQSADLAAVAGGVETVQFRVGGTSDVTAFGLIVDDFKLYSSDSGAEVEVFADDFESYTAGNSLDPNADSASTAPIAGAVVEANSEYASDSFDVFVGGGNQVARIADRATDDAGELRYTPSSAVVTGRMTAQVLREAGAKAEDPNEDAQIAVYGSSTSSANALAYITLDISGDDFDLRDSSGSSGGGSTDGFVEDQVFDIEIAWDASAATATTAPLVTITIDGVVAFTGADFASQSADLAAVAGGVETVQFRVGGTSDVTAFGLIVDDFKLYSSDSGAEVEVFADDFESYTAGNSLDPNADSASTAPIAGAVVEANSEYADDSFDVFVVEE